MTRLPLRVVPQADLQKAWSSGHTYYEHPVKPPRGLEKPLAEQSLRDMLGGQDPAEIVARLRRGERLDYGNAISESRRSFLTTGVGINSLDQPITEGGHTILDFVVDDGPRCLFDAIDLEIDGEIVTDRDIVDDRSYTPYEAPDFRTRDQIQWEQYVSQCHQALHLAVRPTESGSLTVNNIGRRLRRGEDFMRIARSALLAVMSGSPVTTYAELQQRINLVRDYFDDPVTTLYHEPDAREERTRLNAMDDELAHSSYEAFDDEGNLIIHHRSRVRTPWETWHHDISRLNAAATELGFDLCSDAEIESLLGDVAFDEHGNLLDTEREQLLHNENAATA